MPACLTEYYRAIHYTMPVDTSWYTLVLCTCMVYTIILLLCMPMYRFASIHIFQRSVKTLLQTALQLLGIQWVTELLITLVYTLHMKRVLIHGRPRGAHWYAASTTSNQPSRSQLLPINQLMPRHYKSKF